MTPARRIVFIWVFLAMAVLGLGCGSQEHAGQKHDEGSPSGASFKAGKGIVLTEQTREILNVATADVVEEKLPHVIRFNVQVFTQTHRFIDLDVDHTGCDVHGSGFLPTDQAAPIKPKQPVQLTTSENKLLNGFVVAVQKILTHGEDEIIVGITSADTKLKDGEFVSAAIVLPRENPVTVIPSAALLKTSEGIFVYVLNGANYYRTAVKTGSESDGKTEIVDGLYPGDQVVTHPVETLWLIELRATKGGGHCH